MNHNKQSEKLIEFDDKAGSDAWKYAAATFGLGDVITTAAGLQHPEVVEAHPLSKMVLGEYGPLGMVAVKAGALGLGYLAYKNIDRERRIGIPIGLGILGSYIVVNNLNVLMKLR